MQYERPIVISIAGFDPSGGAGVLADVKTFEQHNCLGMAVVSALTTQTENEFITVEWLSAAKITSQLQPLLREYSCRAIKIGLIENTATLLSVIDFIHSHDPAIKITWDPVLAASAGFTLIETVNKKELDEALKKLYLITPNVHEALKLSGLNNEAAAAQLLATSCNVLLKGGHSTTALGRDLLFHENKTVELEATPGEYYAKHGSGCILSSAIAANLAMEKNCVQACSDAKQYIEKILSSNQNLLAYHV